MPQNFLDSVKDRGRYGVFSVRGFNVRDQVNLNRLGFEA